MPAASSARVPASSAAVWTAPAAAGAVHARISLPGSKSLTNRHLLLAALSAPAASGASAAVSRVRLPLDSDDTRAMVHALEQLGASVSSASRGPSKLATESEQDGSPLLSEEVVVRAISPRDLPARRTIDVNQAGTVMRFVPVIAALLPGSTDFVGHQSAYHRPLGPVLQALGALGARVTTLDAPDDAPHDPAVTTLPFRIHAADPASLPQQLRVEVDASASSQFLSACLMGVHALGLTQNPVRTVTVSHTGAGIPSRPHVQMTIEALEGCGVVVVERDERTWVMKPGITAPEVCAVEPDLSNAGPFLAAAMLTGGQMSIPHWPARTTQIGDRWRQILVQLGGEVSWDEGQDGSGTLTVRGPQKLTPASVDDSAELAPTLAALMACAEGRSELTGIAHLRGHETDRIEALAQSLRALGVQVQTRPDGLVIQSPGAQALRAAREPVTLLSYSDHRMATLGAVLGLIRPGVSVEDISVTSKTMPGFARMWEQMLSASEADAVHSETVKSGSAQPGSARSDEAPRSSDPSANTEGDSR